jgi:hypothetical protein
VNTPMTQHTLALLAILLLSTHDIPLKAMYPHVHVTETMQRSVFRMPHSGSSCTLTRAQLGNVESLVPCRTLYAWSCVIITRWAPPKHPIKHTSEMQGPGIATAWGCCCEVLLCG